MEHMENRDAPLAVSETHITVRMPRAMRDALEAHARTKGVGRATVTRWAVEEYLAKHGSSR